MSVTKLDAERKPAAEQMAATTVDPASAAGSETAAPPPSGADPAAAPPAPPAKKLKGYASVFPGDSKPLALPFVALVRQIEAHFGIPVIMLVQRDDGPFSSLDDDLVSVLMANVAQLPSGRPVALLLHSYGGSAKSAFQIANILRKRCGEFVVVIPRYAKSAATLLSLGADRIYLGTYAELGPLDAQTYDPEREERLSALDEVQALDRLHAFALEAFDRSIRLLYGRSRKKISTLFPPVLDFVNGMVRPLFEKIDAVHYTQSSRSLKIAEEYAIRLLQPKYSENDARGIATRLVASYPDHGFFIGAEEAERIGLKIESLPSDLGVIMDATARYIGGISAVGTLKMEEEP